MKEDSSSFTKVSRKSIIIIMCGIFLSLVLYNTSISSNDIYVVSTTNVNLGKAITALTLTLLEEDEELLEEEIADEIEEEIVNDVVNNDVVEYVEEEKVEIKVEEDPVVEEEVVEKVENASTEVISTFSGTMSVYSADCNGCSGYVGCSPYPYVGNGNIYYNDATYGSVRIVAADKSLPCGTIMKVESSKLNEVIYAIVLDRGGAVGFDNKVQLDLLMDSATTNLTSFGLDYI